MQRKWQIYGRRINIAALERQRGLGKRKRAQSRALVLIVKGWFGKNARGSENPVWRLNACFDRQVFCIGREPRIGDFALGKLAA